MRFRFAAVLRGVGRYHVISGDRRTDNDIITYSINLSTWLHTIQVHLKHPAEARDLNISFELVFAARKRYVSGHEFLFKTLSTHSPLQALDDCNVNFVTPCILNCTV